jgi:tetratricopeptide (TPR) repeat protein
MQRAFVIRPFGKKADASGTEIDFEQVHERLIAPALKDAGLGGGTTGEIIDAGNVREDMFSLIIEADLVVCDITVHNANVFYELGIRHALRKRHTVLIKGDPVLDTTPFDVLTDRYVPYNIGDAAAARTALASAIRATLVSDREIDSPVFKMLPALHEIDPATVKAIPTDFTEEVARARAAKSAGWLRLLALELDSQRFQWPALRLVGKAQWDLTDYEGAQETWERIRANDPDDVAANLALGSLYERLYRKTKNAELLEASNQAIVRVRNSEKASADQRVEALTLEGRNEKTLWRLEWDKLDNVAERRGAATNRMLRKAYEAYRKAYLFDLNHYWSGLAALQQGTITLELSNEEMWQDTFDNVDQATA